MPFSIVRIAINPNTSRFYTHSLSADLLEIVVAGENPAVVVQRPQSLMPNGLPDPNGPPNVQFDIFPKL